MTTQQRLLILLLLFLPIASPLNGQPSTPEENTSLVATLDPDLSFPDNYDQALRLMNENQAAHQQAAAHYYGEFALQLAQKNKDEKRILEVLQNIARHYLNHGQYPTADSLYDWGLSMMDDPQHQAILYLDKVGLGVRTRNWGDAEELLQKARKLIGNDTLSRAMANYHFRAGVYEYEAKQNIVEALVHYQEAKEINSKEQSLVTVINNNLAIIYGAVKDFEKSRALNLENLAIAQQQEDVKAELFAYYGLAYSAGMMDDNEALLKYCQKAINLHHTTGVSMAFGYVYSLLGEYYIAKSQLDSAEYYLTKGIALSKKQGENKELVDCYQAMMNFHTVKKEDDLAIEYGELGLTLGTRVDHNIEAPLSELYEKQGNYERAYALLHRSWSKQLIQNQNKSNAALMAKLLEDRYTQGANQ